MCLDEGRPEGARVGRVMGTYLHGLFDSDGVAEALLGPSRPDLKWSTLPTHGAWRDAQLDALAQHLRSCLDLEVLSEIAGFSGPKDGTHRLDPLP